ncbi:hypothetical protein [Natronosalvus rutilus]|uniref:Uncharacterized protein n=1 Tax=Natronosalvus rutilus TaxID=2953753 RepID=A0A9E7NFD0_9EURY|nr:hypothetical protein [Natronosalvus rutilus]UTF55969.1 hypothetical protein NGM29_20980 [Natronosalvus rutilus]
MSPKRDDGPGPQFARFEALFSEELEELQEIATERDVTLEEVSEAYFVIVNGDPPMVTHSRLQEELGKAGPETWNTASVLVDFGEVHRSKGNDWWWIVASEFLAGLCEKRSISLKKYLEMEGDLRVFQDDARQWYERRHMHGNLQERTMREIKLEHCQRLQERYYPKKRLDPENFHDHQVARYVKTAQDVIVEALNLSY